MSDFLFRGDLADLDPELSKLAEIEAERQYRKLILIPSESASPLGVRQALATAFNNIYAEGYPPEYTRWLPEDQILDYTNRLADYRRHSDPRYYKGVEYADIVEALARRRCAETFATNGFLADDIYVNVQALSGAPANNAVYHAMVNPGDVVMGMNLLHGGHLSHGSPVNRSGKYYQIVSYSVDPVTERIDYDAVEALALEHKPKMIIAGVSSYPWMLDWARFREIADKVGAILFADIAHVAGMVAAGVYDSPVGYADVITFTTHKSLCGPRGAVIMTTQRLLARQIDRAVFPGEQGGPHVNVFAAMALAFKLAQTGQFKQLQSQVIKNCAVLTKRLSERGFRIAFNGTNTHLMNLDTKSVTGENGAYLTGDLAARILDIAGVVTNRNTIPGDTSARQPTGVRMGTHWITQRGFTEVETVRLADVIADILLANTPYYQGEALRTKLDFSTFENSKQKIRDLAQESGIEFKPAFNGYPFFYFMDDPYSGNSVTFEIGGERVRQYLNVVVSSDVETLDEGQSQPTTLSTPLGEVGGTLTCLNLREFRLSVPAAQAGMLAAWLRDLSDGFVQFDNDLLRKVPGPVWVRESTGQFVPQFGRESLNVRKPYYIGIAGGVGEPLPEFHWEDQVSPLQRTPIFETHVSLGAKMVPFAGWEMPVRYTSVLEEHLAVRLSAGVFDVAHMGVYQAQGPDAVVFLDSVCGNDISSLAVGESLYTHFLDPDANVVDDLLVYRRAGEAYLVVVNASNDAKDWAWLMAIRNGAVTVDKVRSWTRAFGGRVTLRNLRDPREGRDMRVDIALQGPRSRDILLAFGVDDENRKKVMRLQRTQLCEALIGGFDLIVSRTGYTGEKMAFELFVHPDKANDLFKTLLEIGEPFGIKPIGLGARDSLRVEAGLPLYGHEMGGDLNLGVAEAGFGSYVKVYKPWFIGREAFLARERGRNNEVVRFRFCEKGVRMAHQGDPVVDKRGKIIGEVTSCAADRDGFLIGQAVVDRKYSEEGIPINIYQGASNIGNIIPSDLKIGDRIALPNAAIIIRRFPK
jgi:glycine hydroxymethyltransferase